MDAETVAALRELLGREDVIEAVARLMAARTCSDVDAAFASSAQWLANQYRDDTRAAFAAVLELAGDLDDADRDCHAPVKDAHLHDGYAVGRQVRA